MLDSKGKVQSQKTVNEQNYSWKSSYLPWSSRYRCSISCEVQHNQFRSSERLDHHGLFRWAPDTVVGLYLKATGSECAVCCPGIFTIAHTPRGPWDWDTPTPREDWGSLLCLRLGLDTSWWGYDGSPGIHTVLILLLSFILLNYWARRTEFVCHDLCDGSVLSTGRSAVVTVWCVGNNGDGSMTLLLLWRTEMWACFRSQMNRM